MYKEQDCFAILEVHWQLKCWLVSFNIASYCIYVFFKDILMYKERDCSNIYE